VLRGPGPIAETTVTAFESTRGFVATASSHAFYDGREQSPGTTRTSADVRVAGPLATVTSLAPEALAEIDISLTGSDPNNELIDNHALIEMVFGTPVGDPSEALYIDFSTDGDQASSFDALRLVVSVGDESLIDETFADPASAIQFFATASNLLLGTFASIGVDEIAVSMAIESGSRDDRFSAQLTLTNVPEPSSALLVMAGLVGLSATRRRSRI